MSEIMNDKIEWTVAIPAHLQSINLYTKGAWLYGDEADETNTLIIEKDMSSLQDDYDNGSYLSIREVVEEVLSSYGFEIVGGWDGLTAKAVKSDVSSDNSVIEDEADETSQDLDMTKYVAENHEKNIGEALGLLFSYAQFDGGHHKQWLLDQIVRTLTKEKYEKFIEDYEKDPITGEVYGEWDTGIAP